MTEKFYATVGPCYFSSPSYFWPNDLNHPPSAFLPIDSTQLLLEHPDPLSVKGFQEQVQKCISNGFEKIEVVPRAILETAKEGLSRAQSLLWQMEGEWLYKSIKVLNQTSIINGIGIALIALGAVGTYFIKPEANPEVGPKESKNTLYKRISYASIIAGLALVAFSTFRMNSTAHYLEHILTKIPQID